MLALLSNLKVKVKVISGFACVLALFAIVSVTGVVSFGRIEKSFAAYTQRVAVSSVVEEIGLNTAVMRRHVREFVLVGEEASFEAAQKISKELRDQIQLA